MRKRKVNLQLTSLNTIKMLHEIGYIDDKQKQRLIHGVESGEHEIYKELKKMLIEVAEEIGK